MLSPRRLILAMGLMLAAASAQAAIVFSSHLTGSQEVPPNSSPAFGDAHLVLNDSQNSLSYTVTIYGLDITGTQTASLTDNLRAAHIHASAFSVPGVNGGVVFGFFGAPFNDNNPNDLVVTPFGSGAGGTFSGVWNAVEGNGTTLTAQLPNLLANRGYLNFHSTQFPGGAIRGQILVVPEPGTLVLAAVALGGLCLARRQRASRQLQTRRVT